jgi:hypothetical protein
MVKVLGAASLLVVSIGSVIVADEPIDTKAVIAKALKAHGGADKLRKYPAVHAKVRGKYQDMGEHTYSGEFWLQGEKQFRSVVQAVVDGEKHTEVQVVNGDKGWIVEDDEIQEMDMDLLNETKADMYHQWVTSLAPLEDPKFKFEPVGQSKIGEKEAVGVRVTCKGHRDIKLYFDAKAGLLLKSEMRVIDLEGDNKEVTEETFFQDYKNSDGILYAAKLTIKRDGKDHIVEEVTDYKLAERVDEKLFAKPKLEK